MPVKSGGETVLKEKEEELEEEPTLFELKRRERHSAERDFPLTNFSEEKKKVKKIKNKNENKNKRGM